MELEWYLRCIRHADILERAYLCQVSDTGSPEPLVSYSQIYVLFQILKSMAVSHFLKSTSNDVTDICPNPNQYKSAKDQRIGKRL